jgi:hypothetical protein
MSDAKEALQAWVEKIRSLEDTSGFAEVAAPILQADIETSIEANRGPDGKRWELTKAGYLPLKNAAKALTVVATANTIVATLKGPEALHHLGAARGHVKRQILPTRAIPDSAVRSLEAAWHEWCAEKLK